MSRVWRRYVAIGDSFTEGMSDPDEADPGRYRGWADRLAGHLAADAADAAGAGEVGGFGYANLAVRGRLLADIATRQVDDALSLRPDLVSIVGGGNDILRPRADIDALAGRLDTAVARIRATGADVLMATPTDPRGAPIVQRTRGRVGIYIAHIHTIARRHGAAVLDLWGLVALQDWRMWAEDRIHLTPEGHRRVALAAHATLHGHGEDDDWAAPLPPAAALTRLDRARADAQWAREHAAPWVRRRLRGESSGDDRRAKRPELSPVRPEPSPLGPGLSSPS
jgi:lysophospholipase L1-like esterase